MKIRYQYTHRRLGRSEYDAPDDTVMRETTDPDVSEAVEAFNQFLAAVYGTKWQVEIKEDTDDDFAS